MTCICTRNLLAEMQEAYHQSPTEVSVQFHANEQQNIQVSFSLSPHLLDLCPRLTSPFLFNFILYPSISFQPSRFNHEPRLIRATESTRPDRQLPDRPMIVI